MAVPSRRLKANKAHTEALWELLLMNGPRRLHEVENTKLIVKTHIGLFRLEEIRNIIQSAGFMDFQIFTRTHTPWNMVLAQKSE